MPQPDNLSDRQKSSYIEDPSAHNTSALKAFLVNAGDIVASTSATYATRYDEVSDTVAYVGKALPGTSSASATWQIKRITLSGADITEEYADGDDSFDNIWDNRASLSYS